MNYKLYKLKQIAGLNFKGAFLVCCLISLSALKPSVVKAADLTGYNFPNAFNVRQSTAELGSVIDVDFNIINLHGTVTQDFNIGFYLSQDSTISTADYHLGDLPITANFGFGSYFTNGLSVSITLPSEASFPHSGNAYIGIVIDNQNQVSEVNENNNRNQGDGFDRDSLNITVPQADLKGYDGRPEDPNAFFDITETEANWGEVISFQFAVYNDSGGNAGGFKTKLYLSSDTNFGDANDYQLGASIDNTSLQSKFYTTWSGTRTLPSTNPLPGSPTTVYVGMVVDSDNEVAESNEGNNKNQGGGLDYDATPLAITNPAPDIKVVDSVGNGSDLAIDFGSVVDDGAGNSRGVQTVTVLNEGPVPLSISNVSVSGASAFKIIEVTSNIQNVIDLASLPRPIAADQNESWFIQVEFDPESPTSLSGTLTITSDDPDEGTINVSLQGVGTPVPQLSVADSSGPGSDLVVDYGGVVDDGAGGVSTSETITLQNNGSGDLIVQQNGISLLTGSHYSIVSITSSTQGVISLSGGSVTLAGEGAETWSVVVKYDPTTQGQLDDGLRIQSDDPDNGDVTVTLTGRGLQPMDIEVTDSLGAPNDLSMNFEGVHADGTGKEIKTATIELKNVGEAELTVSQNGIALANGTHFNIASIVSDQNGTIDLSAGTVDLAPNESEVWTVTVSFDPSTSGNLSTTLSITSNDPDEGNTDVSLSGIGLAEPDIVVMDSVDPEDDLSLDFGMVLNDGSGARNLEKTITLKNVGTQPLVINQNGLTFVSGSGFLVATIVSSIDGTVNIGNSDAVVRTISPVGDETWTITLRFDPNSNTNFDSTLRIGSNDADESEVDVMLSGEGTQPSITITNP